MTTVAHPLTGEQLPLMLSARAAGKAIGQTEAAVVKLCEHGEIEAAEHEPFKQWRIYTIPLLKRFGILADPSPSVHGPASHPVPQAGTPTTVSDTSSSEPAGGTK